MLMYDSELGSLEVEIELGHPTIVLSRIWAGYNVTTFQELSDQELDYLNDKHNRDIVEQAIRLKGVGPEYTKETLQ